MPTLKQGDLRITHRERYRSEDARRPIQHFHAVSALYCALLWAANSREQDGSYRAICDFAASSLDETR